MRALLYICLLVCSFYNAQATTYYLAAGGTVTNRLNWWTNTNGTGSNPANFTTAGNIFKLRNNAAITLTGNWTVSGAGSGVVVGDSVTAINFTVPAGFSLTGSVLNVYPNATLTLSNNTLPTLTSCVFSTSSTCVYNNSASTTITVPSGSSYYNLTVSGTGATYTMGGALTITGTLLVSTANTLSMNNTATNRTFSIANYSQTNGTLDGGSSNTGDANFTVYINITNSFSKTAGTIDNSSPGQYTCFQYNGGVSETFSTAGTDRYMFAHIANSTTLTLNSNMSLNGSSGQSKTTFTLDAGSVIDANANTITNSSTGTSTNLINGYFITSNTNGFSGAAATAISSSNGPTITLGAASTVEYDAVAAQSVTTRTDYNNVTITNNSVKSAGGSNTLTGTFLINSGATFNSSTFSHRVNTAVTNNGTFQTANTGGFMGGATTSIANASNPAITFGASSTIEYNGTAAQAVTKTSTIGVNYVNVVISNNSIKTAGGACIITDNFTINSTANFDASSYTHNVGGDFTNGGTFTGNTSTINFNGSSAQTITGSSTTTFKTLQISNTGGNVTLSVDANVATALILSSGLLNTTATPNGLLVMQNGSTAPALTAASTSYVNGPLAYMATANASNTTINLPIGAGADCRPLQLTVNNTDNSVYTYLAQSFNANAGALGYSLPPTCDTISGVHYWTIGRYLGTVNTPSAGINGNQSIRIYFGTNDYVYQGGNVTIVKNTSASPTTWFDIGGACSFAGNFPTPQSGYITSTSSPSAFTSFSTFSLGSLPNGWNSLPVTLLNFSAVLNDKKKVDLDWTSEVEVNNKYFTIERSTDGQNFTELFTVPSKAPNGNSTAKINYKATDHSPLENTSYYRLKQTDLNGKNKTFNSVSVNMSNNGIKFVVYPNPNRGEFKVDFSGVENNHEVQILLTDQHGREVYTDTFYAQEANNTVNIIPPAKINNGTYFCSLIAEGVKYTTKVVVN